MIMIIGMTVEHAEAVVTSQSLVAEGCSSRPADREPANVKLLTMIIS